MINHSGGLPPPNGKSLGERLSVVNGREGARKSMQIPDVDLEGLEPKERMRKILKYRYLNVILLANAYAEDPRVQSAYLEDQLVQ